MKNLFLLIFLLVLARSALWAQAPSSEQEYTDLVTIGAGMHMAVLLMAPETFSLGYQHYIGGKRRPRRGWFVGGRLQLGWESRSALFMQINENVPLSQPVWGRSQPFIFAKEIDVPDDPGLASLRDRETMEMEYYLTAHIGKRWPLGRYLTTSLSVGMGINYLTIKEPVASDYFVLADERFDLPPERIRNHQQAYISLVDYTYPVNWQLAGILRRKYLVGAELSLFVLPGWGGTPLYLNVFLGRQF
jgi:hypothetical protein